MKTVIVNFERGRADGAGRFRIVCLFGREPTVEVCATATDVLGVQASFWKKADGFDKVKIAELLRDALLKLAEQPLATAVEDLRGQHHVVDLGREDR